MKVLSKKIRQSARLECCSFRFPGICNFNNETTVWCHINSKFKGVGMKSPDIFGGYGCSNCHDVLDGRRHADIDPLWILDGLFESQIKLLEKNLLVYK